MRSYGRIKSTSPPRAHQVKANLWSRLVALTDQKAWSYRYAFPPAQDQGQFGTCVANATAGLFDFFYLKRLGDSTLASRRAIYDKAKRSFTPDDITDDGLETDQGIMVWADYGWIPESECPYPTGTDPAALFVPITGTWRKDLLDRSFADVAPDVASIKLALSKHGPVLVGLQWSSEWEDIGADGVLPAPKTVAGGHCVVIVGWDDAKQAFEVRNSWGTSWGDKGYCWLPYSFAKDYPDYFPTDLYTVVV